MEDVILALLVGVAGLIGGLIGYFLTNWKLFQIDRRLSYLEAKAGKGGFGDEKIEELLSLGLDAVQMFTEGKELGEISSELSKNHKGIIVKSILKGISLIMKHQSKGENNPTVPKGVYFYGD